MRLEIQGYKDKHEFISDKGVRSVVYLMDCEEGMKQIPEKYFELAIVDPPYGISADENLAKNNGKKYGGKTLAKRGIYEAKCWDRDSPSKEYFLELERSSENSIIWGANHFISKIPIDSSCWLVWDKHTNGAFADCELAWSSFNTAVRKFDYMWNGMLQENMKNKEKRFHPTQKPIALYEWLIKNYSKPNDKILDTHLGSQSSRIACHKAELNFMGFELDEDYFRQGNQRFMEIANQKVLW